MNILAIDPADKKPIAMAANFPIWKWSQPIDAGWLYLWSQKMDREFLLSLFGVAQERTGTLVIEGQFRGMFKTKTGRFQAQNNTGLVRASAMIQCPFYACGWKVVEVNPSTWHAKVLGNGKVKSAEAKKLSMRKAFELIGDNIDNDDQADAICIFDWYRNYGPK